MVTDTNNASLLKRALLKIEELEGRLKEQVQFRREPIAVVGIGCRFPGNVNDAASFWQLLIDGKDAIGPIPHSRWKMQDIQSEQKAEAKIYVDCGGFLDAEPAMFDSHFFGISSREAKLLDPQQRLLLETVWEALEDAGQNSEELTGSMTGVFLGMASNDYEHLAVQNRNRQDYNLYFLTGNAFSTASGRISYFLGLNGPGMTIDTACSASLTSVNYAAQSIWNGECDSALAGGVNLVLAPEDLLSYCNASMISTTGRCKSFDSSADGFILSEGCGIVVLKRVSDALKNGDRIYALIRGSAVNQDGASNGLTAPSSPAQAMLIREALKRANLNASDIGYIEAHGSGTPLGDPIEVKALASVFGKRDSNNPLLIGCVKTNIGHCAAAAGIAGFIKTVLALHHKKIPRNLHFSNPNPLIPWNDINARIPVDTSDWSSGKGVRRAGVSSFGVSGTNAHVILEEAPSSDHSGNSREWYMLPLSARTETALNALAVNLRQHINNYPLIPVADIAFTLQTGRKKFPYRRFAVCRNSTEAVTALGNTDGPASEKHCFQGRIPKVIFVFPGQGTQYPGMGSSLYRTEPAFREAFDQCTGAFKQITGEDLRQIIFTNNSDENVEKLKNTLHAQPALFTIEYALARLWQSFGVQPAALVGHSIGEFAAACIAGVTTLDDAVSLIAKRSHLMHSLPPGAMVSVRASDQTVIPMLSSDLSIAAINSPALCVVSGPFEAIREFQSRCEFEKIPYRPLQTSHAFHSAMVEPILPAFRKHCDTIQFANPSIPIMSTVTGSWLSNHNATDPMYWTSHMRETVRFSDSVRKLLEECTNGVFLEIGPRSTSTILIRQHIRDTANYSAIASLSDTGEPDGDLRQLSIATGHLWTLGITPDWKSFYRNEKRLRVSLPTYSFERQHYWIDKNNNDVFSFNNYESEPQKEPDTSPAIDTPTPTNQPKCKDNEKGVKLRNLLATALGCPPESIDETVPFLNLGMDSLLMRQFSQQINSSFDKDISIRQLMREYSTVQTLTSYINSTN